jgi:hypothetical protein
MLVMFPKEADLVYEENQDFWNRSDFNLLHKLAQEELRVLQGGPLQFAAGLKCAAFSAEKGCLIYESRPFPCAVWCLPKDRDWNLCDTTHRKYSGPLSSEASRALYLYLQGLSGQNPGVKHNVMVAGIHRYILYRLGAGHPYLMRFSEVGLQLPDEMSIMPGQWEASRIRNVEE